MIGNIKKSNVRIAHKRVLRSSIFDDLRPSTTAMTSYIQGQMQHRCIQLSLIAPIDGPPYRDFGVTKTAGEPFYKANKGQ